MSETVKARRYLTSAKREYSTAACRSERKRVERMTYAPADPE